MKERKCKWGGLNKDVQSVSFLIHLGKPLPDQGTRCGSKCSSMQNTRPNLRHHHGRLTRRALLHRRHADWMIDLGLARNPMILLHNITTEHILEALEHRWQHIFHWAWYETSSILLSNNHAFVTQLNSMVFAIMRKYSSSGLRSQIKEAAYPGLSPAIRSEQLMLHV